MLNMSLESQKFVLMIIEKFVLPFAVAVLTYYLFKKHDEYVKRRQYSTLGVAVMDSLIEEIGTGIEIMRNQNPNPLPVRSWNGASTISDDVLLRILAVSKKVRPIRFPPQQIRIHCKNYFTHMAENWSIALQTGNLESLRTNYVDAAEGVKAMVIQCKDLLETNSRRLFPK
jgi:hypothetical protein